MEQSSFSPKHPDITHRCSHDNLHIRIEKHFGEAQAEAVIALLNDNRQSFQKIFIDVRRVSDQQPSAVEALKRSLLSATVPTDRVIFKGRSGFDMAVSGNRVLIEQKKKHVCTGNCAQCRCGHRKGARDGSP